MPSAILRTVSVQMLTLSCQARWSARFCAEERNLSKEGRSISSRSLLPARSEPASRYWVKKVPKSNSSKGLAASVSGNFFGFFFEESFVGVAVGGGGALFGDFVEDGIGHDFLIDHLAQLQAIQRENADHLHEARRQNLLLRHAQAEFGCEPVHSNQFSRNPSPRYTRRTSGSLESSAGVPALKIFPSLMM